MVELLFFEYLLFVTAMALSLSNFLIPITLILLLCGTLCEAATVTYNFNISWLPADPVGIGTGRPVIGINGQWPLPPIEVTKGDRVIINAYNGLGNQSTSLHMHGLFMNGTTHMDGAAQVSQCAIAPGASFTYNFTVSNFLTLPNLDADRPCRSTNRAHTGTTLTSRGSIQTASEDLSSFTIQTVRIRINTMKRLSLPSRTGITIWATAS